MSSEGPAQTLPEAWDTHAQCSGVPLVPGSSFFLQPLDRRPTPHLNPALLTQAHPVSRRLQPLCMLGTYPPAATLLNVSPSPAQAGRQSGDPSQCGCLTLSPFRSLQSPGRAVPYSPYATPKLLSRYRSHQHITVPPSVLWTPHPHLKGTFLLGDLSGMGTLWILQECPSSSSSSSPSYPPGSAGAVELSGHRQPSLLLASHATQAQVTLLPGQRPRRHCDPHASSASLLGATRAHDGFQRPTAYGVGQPLAAWTWQMH